MRTRHSAQKATIAYRNGVEYPHGWRDGTARPSVDVDGSCQGCVSAADLAEALDDSDAPRDVLAKNT